MANETLVAELKARQEREAAAGTLTPVEDLLRQHPELAGDERAVFALVRHEMRCREKAGRELLHREYLTRFPQFRELLELEREYEDAVRSEVERAFGPPAPGAVTPTRSFSPPEEPAGVAESPPPSPEDEDLVKLGVLGAGGEGSVYLVWEKTPKRTAACKVVWNHGRGDSAESGSVDREAEALAPLDHPNIARLYSTGRGDGFCYLLREHVEGCDLRSQLGAPWEPLKVAALGEELAGALQHAHDRGVVHGDVKPENVMMRLGTTPVLIDFNVSAVRGGQARGGTLTYMSPERVGTPERVNPREDLYGLGLILSEALTGRRPGPAGPPELPTATPAELAAIVRKCLAKDYPSAGAVAHALRRFRASRQPRPTRGASRLQSLLIAVFIAVVAGTAGAGLLLLHEVWGKVSNLEEQQRANSDNYSYRDKTYAATDGATDERLKDYEKAWVRYTAGHRLTGEEPVHLMGRYAYLINKDPAKCASRDLIQIRCVYESLLGEGHDTPADRRPLLHFAMGTVHDNYSLGLREDTREWREAKGTAISYYRKAIEENKDCAPAWNNLADTQVELGDAADVVANARKALQVGNPLAEPSVLAARLDTLLQAHVLQARVKGRWDTRDLAEAKRAADELISSLNRCGKRYRADYIASEIRPKLAPETIPTAESMKAAQANNPLFTKPFVLNPVGGMP